MHGRKVLTSLLFVAGLLVLTMFTASPTFATSQTPDRQFSQSGSVEMKAVDCSKLSTYPAAERKALKQACGSRVVPDSFHEGNCGFVSVGVFADGAGNGTYDISIGSTVGPIQEVFWNGNWVNFTTGNGAGVSGDLFPKVSLWASGQIPIPTGRGFVSLTIPSITMITPSDICFGNGDDTVTIP